jgi:hypothetical protein
MWNYIFKLAYSKINKKTKRMKVLINASHHPARKWGKKEEKKGWDIIEEVKPPDIKPGSTDTEVDILADSFYRKIKEKISSYPKDADISILVHADYPIAYKVIYRLKNEGYKLVHPVYIKSPEKVRRAVHKYVSYGFDRWIEV